MKKHRLMVILTGWMVVAAAVYTWSLIDMSNRSDDSDEVGVLNSFEEMKAEREENSLMAMHIEMLEKELTKAHMEIRRLQKEKAESEDDK